MRIEREVRITDTKNKLSYLHQQGMSNFGIGIRLHLVTRTIQSWWNDTCPTSMNFYRLCSLVETIKLQVKRDSEPKHETLAESRARSKKRLGILLTHQMEVQHPDGECDECRRILKEYT